MPNNTYSLQECWGRDLATSALVKSINLTPAIHVQSIEDVGNSNSRKYGLETTVIESSMPLIRYGLPVLRKRAGASRHFSVHNPVPTSLWRDLNSVPKETGSITLLPLRKALLIRIVLWLFE